MQAITGVFHSRDAAAHAVRALRSAGISDDKITLLTPGDVQTELLAVPVDTAERPGIGKAIGTVVGAASGLSGGSMILAFLVPGVGLVTAAGVLGVAILGMAGAAVGAAAGGSLENSTTQGLPEDEIFVYEDVLRKGRSVVVAMAEDADEASRFRDLLSSEGAEAIDTARHQWWVGLRSAEREHYGRQGKDFDQDEHFYRLGFEAALHSRSRCQEFDQVAAEMARNVEELERQHPGREVREAYTRGYQRGREYYERLCNGSKAA